MLRFVIRRTILFSCISSAVFFFGITQSAYACVDSGTVYMGTVCVTANSFCPRGYTNADGHLLPIADNQALYSLMGTAYGGDGRTTFAVPDLRGRSIVGIGQGLGLTNVLQGAIRGRESIVQTVTQMPNHTHPAAASEGSGTLQVKQVSGQNIPQEGFMLGAGGGGPSSATIYVDPDTPGDTVNLRGVNASAGSIIIGETGDNQPISTVPPQLGLRPCIAIEGLYPSRP